MFEVRLKKETLESEKIFGPIEERWSMLVRMIQDMKADKRRANRWKQYDHESICKRKIMTHWKCEYCENELCIPIGTDRPHVDHICWGSRSGRHSWKLVGYAVLKGDTDIVK